jgi:hypothetical protein
VWRVIGTNAQGHAWYARAMTSTNPDDILDAADSLNCQRMGPDTPRVGDEYRFFACSPEEWEGYWKEKFGDKTLISPPKKN